MNAPAGLPALCIVTLFSTSLFSQDIFFTISAEYNSDKVAIDSIHIQNFTNGTSFHFTELPVQEEYVINMTIQEIVEPIGMSTFEKVSGFNILHCFPGELAIICDDPEYLEGFMEVYNISGQMIHQAPLRSAGEGSFSVSRVTNALLIVCIRTKEETGVFKAIPDEKGSLTVLLARGTPGAQVELKGVAAPKAQDFSVNIGDSLSIMAFKDNLYSLPAFVKVSENNHLLITFSDTPFLKINENTYELNDGAVAYHGIENISGIHSHEILLLSPGLTINWETLDVSGSGAMVRFNLHSKQADIQNGDYSFSTPELMETILVLDTIICDSTDTNMDGLINEDDCRHSMIYTMPDGAKYISTVGSEYSENTTLIDNNVLGFQSGYVSITVEGDQYKLGFLGTGENGDEVQGYYQGALHFFDYSEPDSVVIFQYEEALNNGYTLLFNLLEHAWLIDGIFCGEYAAPSSAWYSVANRTLNSTDSQVYQLWGNAYDLVFNANNIIDSISMTDLPVDEKIMVTAEARAMRAYGYYILISKFGDVPIYPGISHTQIPRSPVAEVTDLIIADLTYAVSSLPNSYYGANHTTRFDWGSVMALLAKINFLDQNWTAAYSKTIEIMNRAMYMTDGNNKYSSLESPDNIQAYDTIRNPLFAVTYDKGSVVPVSHYSEQLLIALECEVRTGNLNMAGSLYMTLTGTENNTPALDDVYNLWRNLMNKEGVTLATIQRYGKLSETLQIQDYQGILPLPQIYLDANPYLTQNPGY